MASFGSNDLRDYRKSSESISSLSNTSNILAAITSLSVLGQGKCGFFYRRRFCRSCLPTQSIDRGHCVRAYSRRRSIILPGFKKPHSFVEMRPTSLTANQSIWALDTLDGASSLNPVLLILAIPTNVAEIIFLKWFWDIRSWFSRAEEQEQE